MNSQEEGDAESRKGFFYALGAYGLWGLMPFYMKAVSHVPAYEVVAHRILWSVPIAGVILLLLGRTSDLKVAFRQPRTLALAALTATLISINWWIYIWAVSVDRTVETALGYYINPLVNICLGALFLRERFTKPQTAAIGLAVIAVVILTVNAGGLPWISLTLAFSFGIYGFLRKTLPIGPTQGFMLEVLLLSLPALALLWLFGDGHFTNDGLDGMLLLMLAGPVTAFPLILYAFGAKLLKYSTIGLMQYTAPTLIFLIAVFVFKEPFSYWQFVAFCFIWAALAIYSWSSFRTLRARPAASAGE
ncbi:EamA family transporter RarD [Hoeflea sp. WL0058]|uniref:EamA family transporter RarD n=1 Tax=Flavimaribacter sediminis TaxID=2865987 RepID=A0AAE3D390_9HYPH|nr:EamA family transporter RarD [Flavimaribacter sediminis]MBW8639591.1 EamA family transporter RarD [Flavimaribacter sediminis]